ncbi:MAG TPA: hypothetical protein VHE32_06660 [Rhodanobacteraceae bacterium]|jgi:hypothetical protein|nr:hypothetical protein [Rhodanobacteraceae bacterium]
MLRAMPLTPFLIGFYGFAILCVLIAFGHAGGARRHWRSRRRVAAAHRALWSLVFVLLALLGALGGTALLGYRRLTAQAHVATIDTRQIAPRRYAIAIELPDGTRRSAEIDGDDWQLDARVIKWDPRAVVLGAPALYRLDRLSGRWRDAAKEAETPKSVVALSSTNAIDLWQLKRAFPRWLPWIDADYGSGAYLPLVDGGRFDVTLAAAGGLVARPADASTAEKIRATSF